MDTTPETSEPEKSAAANNNAAKLEPKSHAPVAALLVAKDEPHTPQTPKQDTKDVKPATPSRPPVQKKVFQAEELRQVLMPTLEEMLKLEESMPFHQPVDPVGLNIPVSAACPSLSLLSLSPIATTMPLVLTCRSPVFRTIMT